MPVWINGGLGSITTDVLSQSSVDLEKRETGWVYVPSFDMPEQAWVAFENEHDDEVYIGRTVIEGDLIPGMIVLEAEVALFVNKGRIEDSLQRQVLCGQRLKFVQRLPDRIHPHAVKGGRMSNGEPLYIGMAKINNETLIGRVDPSRDRQLFVPHKNQEVSVKDYQILINGY